MKSYFLIALLILPVIISTFDGEFSDRFGFAGIPIIATQAREFP